MRRGKQQPKFQYTLEETDGDDLDNLLQREMEKTRKKHEAQRRAIQLQEEQQEQLKIEEQEEKLEPKVYAIIEDNPLVYEELVPQFFLFLDAETLLKVQTVCKLWHSLLGTSSLLAKKNSESLKLATTGMFEASKRREKPKRKKRVQESVDGEEETEEAGAVPEDVDGLFDKLHLRQSSFWFTIFERDYGRQALYLTMTGAIHEKRAKKKYKRRIQVGELNVLQYLKEVYMRFYWRMQSFVAELAKCPGYHQKIKEILRSHTAMSDFLKVKSCTKHNLSPRQNHFICLHCNSTFVIAQHTYPSVYLHYKQIEEVPTMTAYCDILQTKLKFEIRPQGVSYDTFKMRELAKRQQEKESIIDSLFQ